MGFSHLVHHWLHGHLHHSACMLFARLQLRKVSISRLAMFANTNGIGLYLASSSTKLDVSVPNRKVSMGVSNVSRARWHRLASWSMLLDLLRDYRAILTVYSFFKVDSELLDMYVSYLSSNCTPANKTRTASPT